MDAKNLKDPIYGYITIPNDVMKNIVDTAEFQRLRHITQTSYAPLYSSALHNRFVHSLGVYHLGKIGGQTLLEEIQKRKDAFNGKVDIKKLGTTFQIFKLACLLHDVGHAPFSHTGEYFYAPSDKSKSALHSQLADLVSDEEFKADIPKNEDSAKNHEIVSAIIGIKKFEEYLKADKAFFARCITGYQYRVKTPENSIKNCFISLLNSNLIDVDKLDYLIRDSYITGYDTVKIDYVRLLTALTVFIKGECATLVYRKGALSVIENVVYAHDSERKWIQTHPVILYENYLLNHSFALLEKEWKADDKSLFSVEALTCEGVTLKKKRKVRLLDDNDILSMMKEYCDKDPLVMEYFERRRRRHPIWKTEAEYKARFEKEAGGKILKKLEDYLKSTSKYLKQSSSGIIDNALIKVLEKDIKDMKALSDDVLLFTDKTTLLSEKENILKIAKSLVSNSRTDSFVLLQDSQFSSGFGKFAIADMRDDKQNDKQDDNQDEIKIVLSDDPDEEPFSFNDLVVSLDSREQRESLFFHKRQRKSLFYLYSNERKSVIDIANSLISCACPTPPKSK